MAAVIFGLPPAFFLPPLAFGVANACATKIVQGWPKLWADFRALTGIFSQSVGPSLAIWANPVQFSFCARRHCIHIHAAQLLILYGESLAVVGSMRHCPGGNGVLWELRHGMHHLI
jgi:hypothetical protein